MKFSSFINPVSLASDPAVGEDGDFYYNTTLKTYRMFVDGVWLSVINNIGLEEGIVTVVQINGDEYTESVSLDIESFHNNYLFYIISASTSYVNLTPSIDEDFPTGASFKVVRGGSGNIEFTTASGVSLNSPSDVYLTTIGDVVSVTKLDSLLWLLEGNFPDLY